MIEKMFTDNMSKTPTFDAKIKAILDATDPGERVCALTGEKWNMTEEEIGWYKKFNVPPSKWAPRTRLKYLCGFAAGIALWWKPHAEMGKKMLSFVHPDSPFQVIEDHEWFSREFLNHTSWSATEPFFSQFQKLALATPVGALRDDGSNRNSIGVDIINTEDGHMVFGSGHNKRMHYFYIGVENEDVVDGTNLTHCHETFQSNHCEKLFNCAFAFESRECMNAKFLFDCRNCEYCFGATNLRNKKYVFFNQQLSKEEWEQRISQIDLSCYSVFETYQDRFRELISEAAWPEQFTTGNEDCTGEYIDRSTRCHDCYWMSDGVDNYACWLVLEHQTSAFSIWTAWGSDVYASCDIIGQGSKFCFRVWHSTDMEYCMNCYHCESCFGCVGLRHKKFCIFNTQYTEAEYYEKLDHIKCAMLERGEYGEFFPADLSECGFQFSMGKMFFDYTPEEYQAFGAPKFDPMHGGVVMPEDDQATKGLRVQDIPDCLNAVDPAQFVNVPIYDEQLKRHFSVVPAEFAFYQQRKLPFPREHFLSRLKKLIRHSNSPIPEYVRCFPCGKDVVTWQNPTFPSRRIYCRACYLSFLEARS